MPEDATKFTLDRLFRFLSPEIEMDASSTTPKALSKKIEKLLIEAKGKAYTWSDIASQIDNFFSTNASGETITTAQLADAQDSFRFLGPTKISKFYDKNYFDGVSDVGAIDPELKKLPGEKSISVFAIRDPMVSPGVAGCDKIGRFLNYTPPFVASQMVPFLDLEFRIEGGSNYTRTPGILRFLLGSKEGIVLNDTDKTFYKGDRIGENGRIEDDSNKVLYTRSGVETFLMPQSLTNMDSLGTNYGASRLRLTPVKPFVPLASIEGFDVSVRNAGAKNFIHKTANLKMKIHDKARISEFEEFVRGGDGFRRVTIVTRYGWRAPRSGTVGENEFFDFINSEMNIEDFWTIVNSQFSFDSTGQVNVGLQLVSAAMRYGSSANVVQESEPDEVKDFNAQMQLISKQLDLLRETNLFPSNVTIAQTLNDAAYKGIYTNKDGAKVNKAIDDFKISLVKWSSEGKLPQDLNIDVLIASLKSLAKQTDKKTGKAGKSLFEKSQEGARKKVDELLAGVAVGPDPWLPKDKAGFNPKLVAEVKKRKGNGTPVASFAKVMLVFAKGLAASPDVDELQVIFYPINNLAGYAGASDKYKAISLAEFPIDINALKASYYARVKELNTTVLNLDEFFKLVLDLNFTDSRGIGFGKSSYYTAIDLTKTQEKPKVITAEAGNLKTWEDDNPQFTTPIIDMVLKVEESLPRNPNERIKRIKKISVYDRASALYEDPSAKTIDEMKEYLEKGVPLITVGTNGSLIMNSTVSSKTDGSQQAVYLARSLQTDPLKGKIDPGTSPTEDANNQLPIRTLPVQFTMTSVGCPIAALYQQYFVDFFTRTSLDNLYMCTQIQHSLSSGKYNTSWTFMQSNGYSKFVRPAVPSNISDSASPPVVANENKKKDSGKKSKTINPSVASPGKKTRK